jgi:membrane protein
MLIALILALTVCIVLQWLSIVFVVVVLLGMQTVLASYIFAAALEWRLVAITNARGKTLVLRAPTMKGKNLTTGFLRFIFAALPLLSAGILQYAFVVIYEELKTQPHITESEASSIQWLPNSLVFLVSFLLVLLAFVYWLLSCAFRIRLNDGKPHMKIISNQFRQLQLLKGTDGQSLLEGYFASVIFCVAGSLSTTWLLNLTSSEKQPLTPTQWGLWFTMLSIFLLVRQLWRILPDIVLENFRGFVSMLLTLVTMWVAILMSLLFCADSLNSAFVAYLSIFMAPELLPTQEQAHDYVQLVGYTVLIYYFLLPRRLVVVAWKKFFTVEPLVSSPTA